MNNPFTSLKHPNFRIYWTGMCISLIGTWMQNIAQPWLAYSITKSAFLLSLIGTLQFTPILLFSLFAGVIIDQFPKKRILLLTQSASCVITLVLAYLVLSNHIEYWHILIMATLLGLVNTLDMPTRQSYAIELVGKDDLMNAIALNSMSFNVARVIGPAVAGLIMGYFGIGLCFLINAFSYLAVVISLLFIDAKPVIKAKRSSGRIGLEIRAGLKYIKNAPPLLGTLLIVAVVGIFVPNFSVLVPVFAKEILHLDEKGFGLLMSSMGVGSFLGAMFIATFSREGPKRWVIEGLPWVIGLLMILTGVMNHFATMAICLGLTGFFFVTFSSSANSKMQLNVSNEYRGRVMSVYTLVFAGSTPIGNLFAGAVSQNFTARGGFIACGLSVVLLMLMIALTHKTKRHPEVKT
jgi:MFS family permease